MVFSDDVRVVLHVRGSVFTVCVLLLLLVSVPVQASSNATLVEELQDKSQTLCDVSPSSSCRGGWDYGTELGPDHWSGVCVAGKHQSPVNLDQEEAKTAEYEPLVFFNYKNPAPMKVTNNGHSIMVEITENCPRAVAVGGLPAIYNLISLHFHWNSEHMFNGKRLPLEVHLVHLKNAYKTIDEARQDSQGLAYIGILFEEVQEENPELTPLVEAVKTVSAAPDTTADVAEFSIASLLPDKTDVFYRYDGSITTPDCDEIVVWTILKNTVPISSSQGFFEAKGSLKRKKYSNIRPMQPLNGRTLFLSNSGTSRSLTRGIMASLLVALSLHV